MLMHELFNKDTYIVSEEAPLIILNGKSAICMAKNCKETKHTRKIARIVHFKGTKKTVKCTGLTYVREVYNWQTLTLRILVIII